METYLSLFAAAFLAATLLPFYSELLFAGLLVAGHPPLILWAVATLGNTLGSAVNWLLGRYLQQLEKKFANRRWNPFGRKELDRARRWFQRYGVWSLLMAWAPIGGDALTLIAGFMRVNFFVFFLLTAIGKGLRYAAVAGVLDFF